jgi:signal transduction histidine kinase
MSLAARFRDMPIRRKLMLVGLLTTGFALLSVSSLLIARSWSLWHERTASEMTILANIVGGNASSTLLFDDRDSAGNLLAGLAARPDIVSAVIQDAENAEFARFDRPGPNRLTRRPLEVTQPIQLQGEQLGTITLVSDLRGLFANIMWDTIAILITSAVMFVLVGLLFARLHKVIADPIRELAEGMQAVSARQDYDVRVAVHGRDEVGQLATAFNDMLGRMIEAREELVRKEKLSMLGQVAGSVGHELRNPLGVMSNAVYFLQTVHSESDETTREYLAIIKNEIAAADRIVGDLLDSVRIKAPHPERVGVLQLVEQVLARVSLPPKVELKVGIPESIPAVSVDAMQIHQVLRNLVSNALEAMPDGGTLEIGAAAASSAGGVTVTVRDTGTGMTPEHRARLFQPLYTTKARGIGLGLVVVKNLTQANGGSVDVQSEVGCGTSFTITLPSGEPAGDAA